MNEHAPVGRLHPEPLHDLAIQFRERARRARELADQRKHDGSGSSSVYRGRGEAFVECAEIIEAQLRAAGEIAPPAPPWQPIETAPKDKPILLGWPTMVLGGYWAETARRKGSWLTAHGEYCGSAAPTHWMPLPPAPPQAPEQEP